MTKKFGTNVENESRRSDNFSEAYDELYDSCKDCVCNIKNTAKKIAEKHNANEKEILKRLME